jgi:hypothetical protein
VSPAAGAPPAPPPATSVRFQASSCGQGVGVGWGWGRYEDQAEENGGLERKVSKLFPAGADHGLALVTDMAGFCPAALKYKDAP